MAAVDAEIEYYTRTNIELSERSEEYKEEITKLQRGQQEADTTRAARYARERDADVDKRDRELAEKEAELVQHEHAFMELTTRSEKQTELIIRLQREQELAEETIRDLH